MWHRVRNILTGASAGNGKRLSSDVPRNDENALQQRGYLSPQTAISLLETENRQHLLRQLWESSLLPQAQYEQYFLAPLKSCVALMQQLPATASDHHAVPGGMVDYTLKTVVFAARLSRGYMLPPGASAEEQSAQSAAWGAVVFYSTLFHSLYSLRQIEGELLNGDLWYPGINVPGQPYRFRFRATIPEGTGEGLCTMLGMRLLPDEVILWLSKTPLALDTLLAFLRSDFDHAGVIYQIVEDAIVHAGGTPREAISQTSVIASQPTMVATSDPLDTTPMALLPSVAPTGEEALSPVGELQVPQALTSVLDEHTPVPVTASGAGQDVDESGIQEVMSLMGFSVESVVAEVQEHDTPSHVESGFTVETGDPSPLMTEEHSLAEVSRDGCEDYGELFISWLKVHIVSGQLLVNTKEAQVHIVGGLVFLPTPVIFFLFMKEKSYPSTLKGDVQRGFERLGLHFMQRGKGVFTCLKYAEENRNGRYEKVSGYFMKSKIIYQSHPVPDDSRFLFINSGA
ncbi:TPA: DNA-binding domain-containing protein [Salmonella enterica subsp. enterica serovar Elisabethville]|nr:DNA-binding domain-containing protein [Salmonella enterica subsp. enterica serovar Elisabethville]